MAKRKKPLFRWINSQKWERVRKGLEKLESLAADNPTIMGEAIGFPGFDEDGALVPSIQLENAPERWIISLWALCWSAKHQGGEHPARLIIGQEFWWIFPWVKLTALTGLRHLSVQTSIMYPKNWIGFGELSQIETLEMRDSGIRELPDVITKLTQLKELVVVSGHENLCGSYGQSLPKTFAPLSNLRILKLIGLGSGVQQIPEGITELTRLESLDLGQNWIAAIPPAIGQLQNLHTLVLRGRITSIPPAIGQLQKLHTLSLRGYGLTELPAEITKLRKLERLDFSGHSLTSLPKGFTKLENLAHLSLHARIESLPSDFGQLVQLRSLSLGGNSLTDLPSSFGQLGQLETLTLNANPFKHIPEPLFALKSLKNLTFPGASIEKSDQRRLQKALLSTTIQWDVDEKEAAYSQRLHDRFLAF